jgi:hypothetical protein
MKKLIKEMKKQLDELIGKKILRGDKPVMVVNWISINGKYILDLGSTRWMIGYESDLPAFLEGLQYCEEGTKSLNNAVGVSVFDENSRTMTQSLLNVFFRLENKVIDDIDIRRAKAMVDVANTVVSIELAKHKILTSN